MPYNAASARTQFKKGHRGGKAAELYQPIGTERVSKDGYRERKIHDGMPFQSRWKEVHRIEWEELHGPVPEGHCLKCRDGDRSNTDPANWLCIPRALLPRLAGRWSLPYDHAPDELKPAVLTSARLEHAAREARKHRSKAR
ncbi:HNH endonuclease signature motif containing protein [Qipengyuania sp.]